MNCPPDLRIIIPSRGRAGKTQTDLLLQQAGLPFYFLVEPHEEKQYRKYGPTITLPVSDQGIAYARNYVIDYARQQGFTWVLMIDDDVKRIGRIVEDRNVNTDASELIRAFSTIKRFNPAIGGIQYRQLAWSSSAEITANRFCDVVVFLNIPKIHWRYRPEMNLKEDRDFVLQAISHGGGVVRVNKYYFDCPAVGSNTGGLHAEYAAGKEAIAVKRMAEAWPGVVKPIVKAGRHDFMTNWRALGV